MSNDSKPQYQPWRHNMFMTEESVRRMTREEKNAYMWLCHEAYCVPEQPYLPDDDNRLWFLANCESLEEWLKVSPAVRGMFKKTGKLLEQKRIVADYKNWESGIYSKKRAGLLSGVARCSTDDEQMFNECSTGVQEVLNTPPTETNKIKESKVKEIKESKEKKLSKPVPLESAIVLSAMEFGLFPEEKKFWKKEIHELEKSVGEESVLAAFKVWAANGYSGRWPIKAFLNQSGGIVVSQKTQTPDLTATLDEIVFVSGNTVRFNTAQQIQLGQLVAEFGSENVLRAFREFYSQLDDYTIKFAAKNFIEQGPQILRFFVKSAEVLSAERNSTEVLKTKLREEADEEIRKTDERLAEEAKAAEIGLPI
jgi:uncharacterized protein YdaU (DUF1376 family)